MEDRFERVLTLIRNHSHNRLDLARLADTASLSRFHFLRLFHRTFRQTPHQLIIRTRIERAKTLLTETAKSVTDICLDRRSVIILWAWTAMLSSFLLFPLFVHQVNAFIPIGAAALGVGLYTFFHPGLRRGNGPRRRTSRPTRAFPARHRAGGAGSARWSGSRRDRLDAHPGPDAMMSACVPRPPRLVRRCPRGHRGRWTPARHAPHKGAAVACVVR